MAKQTPRGAEQVSTYWRLRTLMQEQGIRDAVQLHKLMKPFGFRMTTSQLRRIVASQPVSIRLDLLTVLWKALGARPGDLLILAPTEGKRRTAPQAASDAAESAADAELLGPALPALPKGKFSVRQ